MKSLFIGLQFILPHHLLSRVIGWFAGCRLAVLKNLIIRVFIRIYGVDMSEAEHSNIGNYASFNHFFTRALQDDARPVNSTPGGIICPVDGFISAAGVIEHRQIFQAKGRNYSLHSLLGGDEVMTGLFENGQFLTAYLSPRDYHRIHMPETGTLETMTFIPGRLFSVNPTTCEGIDNLFARNERVVCLFNTQIGPMAVILIGAMIVASIETVWAGRIRPTTRSIQTTSYAQENPSIRLDQGVEIGRFLLGSTVIVLFGPDCMNWQDDLHTGKPVRMGELIGRRTVE